MTEYTCTDRVIKILLSRLVSTVTLRRMSEYLDFNASFATFSSRAVKISVSDVGIDLICRIFIDEMDVATFRAKDNGLFDINWRIDTIRIKDEVEKECKGFLNAFDAVVEENIKESKIIRKESEAREKAFIEKWSD